MRDLEEAVGAQHVAGLEEHDEVACPAPVRAHRQASSPTSPRTVDRQWLHVCARTGSRPALRADDARSLDARSRWRRSRTSTWMGSIALAETDALGTQGAPGRGVATTPGRVARGVLLAEPGATPLVLDLIDVGTRRARRLSMPKRAKRRWGLPSVRNAFAIGASGAGRRSNIVGSAGAPPPARARSRPRPGAPNLGAELVDAVQQELVDATTGSSTPVNSSTGAANATGRIVPGAGTVARAPHCQRASGLPSRRPAPTPADRSPRRRGNPAAAKTPTSASES